MRVLYSHRTLARDGSAVHIRGLVEALRARGHEVVETGPPRLTRAGRGRERPGGLARVAREVAEYAYTPLGAARLLRAIRRRGPDLLYQRYAFADASGVLASRWTGVPLFLEVNARLAREIGRTRGLLFPRLAERLEGWILRRASRLGAVSGVLRDELLEAGVDPGRIVVTPNGADLSRFRPDLDGSDVRARSGLPPEGVLGFAGYLRDWHRLDLVLDAMAASPLAAARLLVVGDGPARGRLAERARTLGLADRVVFTGEVPHADVPRYVAAFDVALLPATNPYASPLKLFEYLAAGKPVVAPRQRNVEEIVRDGREAILVPSGDIPALVAALARLLADAGLRRALARAGRERILGGGFTWEANAERVERAVAPLLGRPNRAAAIAGGGAR